METSDPSSPSSPESEPSSRQAPVALRRRIQRAIAGAPRSLEDKGLHHKLTLVALLAWVGLGADGLSSSAYGPDEAFRAYLLTALRRLHVDRTRVTARATPTDDISAYDAGVPFHDTAVEIGRAHV